MSKSVLLVDCDGASRRSVKSALDRLGYETTTLSNSGLALPMLLLRQVEERPFDLLMLNTDLPDADAIVAKASDSPLFGGVDVILLSSEGEEAAGPRRLVTRPLDAARLEADVSTLLQGASAGA